MNKDIQAVALSQSQIADAVAKAAKWLDGKFAGREGVPLIIGVLKGSVFFFCDLVRAMQTPVYIDFITVSSYGGGTSSNGTPTVVTDLATSVQGRDAVLIEDIIDSGNTLKALKELILSRGAKSFTAVTLLDKPARRVADICADYSCCEIGDEFVVGYGLDYAQKYRTLPYVGILKREVYKK